jgi:hypothetical protein
MAGTNRRIRSNDTATVAQALAYAIEATGMLPPQAQQATDKTQWIALLHAITPHGQAASLRLLARARLEQRGIEVR